ncbi:unnamed protein product [Rhizophagus irregularis]|nr:unnamed protein product [Rhizophagus irregularis]
MLFGRKMDVGKRYLLRLLSYTNICEINLKKLDAAIFAILVFHIYHFINERLKKRSHSRSQRTLDKLVNELTKSAGFNDELTFDSAFQLGNKERMAQALVNEEVKTIAQKVSLRIFNEIGEDNQDDEENQKEKD